MNTISFPAENFSPGKMSSIDALMPFSIYTKSHNVKATVYKMNIAGNFFRKIGKIVQRCVAYVTRVDVTQRSGKFAHFTQLTHAENTTRRGCHHQSGRYGIYTD